MKRVCSGRPVLLLYGPNDNPLSRSSSSMLHEYLQFATLYRPGS